MSSIFGFTGNKFNLDAIKVKLEHWVPDRFALSKNDNINCGVLELFKTEECHINPQPFSINNLIVALDGRIDNRVHLSTLLNLPNIEQQSDVVYVAKAYEKWGESCVDYLIGDFAFSVWDKEDNSLFIARDHMGVKPMFYALVENELVFSSEMKGILAVNSFEKKINERYVVSAFSSLILDSTESLYQDIFCLPPAHYLVFKGESLTVKKYWNLGHNKPSIPKSVDEQFAKFGDLFNQSVVARLRSAREIGAEVSGGLDSSGIAAFAMENLGKGHPLYSYCYGKPNTSTSDLDSKDDSDLVKQLCADYQISEYLTVTNELDLSGKDYLKYYGEILDDLDQNGVPLLATSFLPKAKKSNVSVMLSGWAGDQIVTSTVGGFYEAKANKRMYKSLWDDLGRKHAFKKQVVRFFYYILKAYFKPFYKKNLKISRAVLKHGFLKESLIEKYNLRDLPSRRYFLKSCTNIKEYQVQNISHEGIVGRTMNHGLIGKHFNIDYRFPMLDVRLLEYVQELPISTTAPKGKTRFLFKKLIRGKVPDGIVDLHKSYVPTTPFGRAFFKQEIPDFKNAYEKKFSADLDPFFRVKQEWNSKYIDFYVKSIQLFEKLKK